MTTQTKKRTTRAAAAGLAGALSGALVLGLAALPAQAAPQVPGLGNTRTAGPITAPVADPFVPIIDIDAERAAQAEAAKKAEEKRKKAEAKKRAEAKRKKAEEARKKAEAQRKAQAAKAARSASASKVKPVQRNYRLTARFGQGGGYWSGGRHTGLDFAAPVGTPVVAARSGTVIKNGWEGSYGRRIEIRHSDGTVTTYSHLSGSSVSTGQTVAAGQRIGSVGNTGNSTGPHLHFEVKSPSGSFLNPQPWLGI